MTARPSRVPVPPATRPSTPVVAAPSPDAWERWFEALPASERALLETMAEHDRTYGDDFAREAADLVARRRG